MNYSFLTVGTIIDASLAETLGSSTSSQTALQDDALIREVDRINRRFLSAPYTEATNESWSWMDDEDFPFETYDATALTSGISAGASTFDVNSVTGFPDSGLVWIDTNKDIIDFVHYESKSSTTLTVSTTTGDETVDIDHDTDHVELAYALPSDFGKAIEVYVDGTPYYEMKTRQLPIGNHYKIFGNFIVFPRDIGTRDVNLLYQRGATDLDTGNNTTDRAKETQIPVDFLDYPFHMLNAYIQRQRRKKESMADELALAREALDHALATDINQSEDYIYA